MYLEECREGDQGESTTALREQVNALHNHNLSVEGIPPASGAKTAINDLVVVWLVTRLMTAGKAGCGHGLRPGRHANGRL
ncbi:hypothetical protein ElyMa_000688600 [Elysia marginata]|uniref:Uncharacterized protein n=1 Tax=Elysia marginata TaxID=1093978 RepID=A0AAV4GHE3_9GAST|nr:hypothetical protein ElyMa_000688600 [Elysia marginata]